MGYTHYWYKEDLDETAFLKFLGDARAILATAEQKLGIQVGHRAERWQVRIDGGGCESFIFSLQDSVKNTLKLGGSTDKYKSFCFCKTARYPYDQVVCALLIAAKFWFGEQVRVFSDGEDADWDAGRQLCYASVGYGREYGITGNNEGFELKVKNLMYLNSEIRQFS